jgi:N-acetylglucosamine-6-phosphate deacetylase
MTRVRVLYGRGLLEGEVQEGTAVTVRDGRIEAVARLPRPPAGAEVLDGILAPGFVDLHVHGGGGADFMDAEPEAVGAVAAFHLRHGTVALAATTLSASREAVGRCVAAVARAWRREREGDPGPPRARIVALHLEGPYLNPRRAGAQDPEAIRPADPAELAGWLDLAAGLPVTMTVAPEAPGVADLIPRFRGRTRFAIGHTEATFEQARSALDLGARHFTHLFNAMPPLDHHRPGPVGAALASGDATAELIADGVHVHPALLALAFRALPGRAALVTDAMRAAGMPEGVHALGRLQVTVAAGAARLADGTLAGSLLTMDRAVANLVERAGLPLAAALTAAAEVPARVLDLPLGRLAPGCPADLVELGDDLAVRRVLLGGEEVAAG